MRTAGLFLIASGLVALASCASVPQSWTRTDGSIASAQQLAVDQTACRGEMQKAGLAGNPNEDFLRAFKLKDVFVGCMAEKGYVSTN